MLWANTFGVNWDFGQMEVAEWLVMKLEWTGLGGSKTAYIYLERGDEDRHCSRRHYSCWVGDQ